MTQSDADELQRFSKFLWNSEIWRAAVNVQHRFEDGYEPADLDSLRLDLRQLLSDPDSRIKHRQIGSVWIDVNVCGLRLERMGEVIVACGDSSEKVLTHLKQLVGKTLAHVRITPPGGDADFVLEGGLVLRCFPATGDRGESLRISSEDNDELVLGPGPHWSYRSGIR